MQPKEGNSGAGLSVGAVVGIAISAVLVLMLAVVLAGLIVVLTLKRDTNRQIG